jgi:hypothetical protein
MNRPGVAGAKKLQARALPGKEQGLLSDLARNITWLGRMVADI